MVVCDAWVQTCPAPPRSSSTEPPSASLLQETHKSNHSRTYGPFACNFNYSRTYEIPGGWGVLVIPIFSLRALHAPHSPLACPPQLQRRRATSCISFVSPTC